MTKPPYSFSSRRIAREPDGQIACVSLDRVPGLRVSLHAVTRRLADEAWAPVSDIPIVVAEMMERRLGNATALTVSLATFGALERDDEIKGPPGHPAAAVGDDPGALIAGRHTDPALMRMGGEKPDGAARRSLIAQQRMYGIDHLDDLKVAIGAGMVIRPQDLGGVGIVDTASLRIGIRVVA